MKKIYPALLLFILLLCPAVQCKAQQYEVKGAGAQEVNGIYVANGTTNGKPKYVKGDFVLFYKGCEAKWMIKSAKGNYYRNMNDTPTPPESGWEKGCAKGSAIPAPTVKPVNGTLQKKN